MADSQLWIAYCPSTRKTGVERSVRTPHSSASSTNDNQGGQESRDVIRKVAIGPRIVAFVSLHGNKS